jgi:uncharacterized protein YdaU (DUF1376 family)
MSKTKAPAYQWYPRDFAADEPVILMSLEEEGAYRRLLDHQWSHGSVPADISQIAIICKNAPVARMRRMWGAIARCFEPLDGDPERLVNRRLERVRQEAERFRDTRSESGRLGAEKRWGKQGGDDSGANGGAIAEPMATDSSSSSSSTSSSNPPTGDKQTGEIEADFERAWRAYPRRPNDVRGKARKAYLARRKAGVSAEELQRGVEAYAAYVQRERVEPRYVKQAGTFFGPDEHWLADFGEVASLSPGERVVQLFKGKGVAA